MISIIVCSRNNIISPLQENNIQETIGLPYEIIWIDNSNNNNSAFSAFNKGAQQSKYNILCFMHDDILFRTNAWGKIVESALMDEQTGVLGIAGSLLKTYTPSPWWISNYRHFNEYLRLNVLQRRGQEQKLKLENINPENEKMAQVQVVDGVWMCCKKELWNENKFDEKTFSHFHFHDMDFCLMVSGKGYKNYVLYNVLIEHNSAGYLDSTWVDAAEIFTNKWKNVLPVSLQHLSKKVMKDIEYEAIKNYLILLSANQYGSLLFRLNYWFKTLFLKRFQKEHLILLKNVVKNL
ncbi:MAG: glycosyltransferase [Chitinophagaceae bacterium]